jgi:outer membrane protein FlgP
MNMELSMNRLNTVFIFFLCVLLASCSMFGKKKRERQQALDGIAKEVQMINEKLPPMKPMLIRASGFGTINPKNGQLSSTQKQLIAMRASKLDAYRSLAERVYGTQISGNTTVENLVIQNDRFKTYVDTYILGARVVSQDVLLNGSYQTTVEMILDEGFRNCITNENNRKKNIACASQMVHDLKALNNDNSEQAKNGQLETGLYFIE